MVTVTSGRPSRGTRISVPSITPSPTTRYPASVVSTFRRRSSPKNRRSRESCRMGRCRREGGSAAVDGGHVAECAPSDPQTTERRVTCVVVVGRRAYVRPLPTVSRSPVRGRSSGPHPGANPMAADSVLAQVLARVADRAKAGTLPVVIFDLDDTLFSTAQRNLFIIREFAADHGAQYPDFARVAAPLGLDDMSWSVTDALERAGLAAGSPSLAPSAFPSFWSARFFSNRYVELDLPNPGAVDYTRACHEAGALIFYLTGRHVGQPDVAEGMEQGTARSMTVRGFPFWTGRCELTLKRHAKEKDTEYKARALRVAESLGG